MISRTTCNESCVISIIRLQRIPAQHIKATPLVVRQNYPDQRPGPRTESIAVRSNLLKACSGLKVIARAGKNGNFKLVMINLIGWTCNVQVNYKINLL